MDYAALKTLIDSEPSNAAATDEEVLAWCNTPSVATSKTHLQADEILNICLTDTTEWLALTNAGRDTVLGILEVNASVPVETGTPTREALQDILGTNTKAALGAALPVTLSPADNAGLGVVNLGDVENARAL